MNGYIKNKMRFHDLFFLFAAEPENETRPFHVPSFIRAAKL